LTSERFYVSLKATVIYGFATVIQLGLALTAALIVNKIKFKSLFSGMYLLPYTMPPVATGTLWVFLLKPNLGPIFTLLTDWGSCRTPSTGARRGHGTAGSRHARQRVDVLAVHVPHPVRDAGEHPRRVLRECSRLRREQVADLLVRDSPAVEDVHLRGGHAPPGLEPDEGLAATADDWWGARLPDLPLSLLLYRSAFSDGNLGEAFAVGIIFLLLVLAFIVLFIRYFEKSEGDQL